jgi:hypothetical protein
MLAWRIGLSTCAALLFCISLAAQEPNATQSGSTTTAQAPERDPQALAVLTRALNAAGGASAIGGIKDFTAAGTITYYWAGKETQGPVTLRGLGADAFRLDASLLEGARAVTVDRGAGSVKEINQDTASTISYSQALSVNSMTFPQLLIAEALGDNAFSISYEGTSTVDGHSVYEIRLQHILGLQADPDGSLTNASTRELSVDATSYLVVETRSTLQIPRTATNVLVQMDFSAYGPANGVVLPFTITQSIGGQTGSVTNLNSIQLNTGLTDANFQF